MKPIVSALALLSLANATWAQLAWDKKELEFFPDVTEKVVNAEFNFTNVGRDAVTVLSVEPGCDCTTASLEKTTYEPGEKGRISAVFTIGGRTGLQTKSIRVSIQGDREATSLAIVAHIPEVFKLSPRLVFWQSGDKPEAKTIELTAVRDVPLQVARVTSSDPAMKVALRTVQPGKTYQVVVTPERMDKPIGALVTIEAEVAPDVRQVFTAYAHVRPSGSERAKIVTYDHGQPVATEPEK